MHFILILENQHFRHLGYKQSSRPCLFRRLGQEKPAFCPGPRGPLQSSQPQPGFRCQEAPVHRTFSRCPSDGHFKLLLWSRLCAGFFEGWLYHCGCTVSRANTSEDVGGGSGAALHRGCARVSSPREGIEFPFQHWEWVGLL